MKLFRKRTQEELCNKGKHVRGTRFYERGYPYWNGRDFVYSCIHCHQTVKIYE